MADAVYLLCAATSIACAVLLLRSYLQQHTRLLLWSSLCFAFLAANNAMTYVDVILMPGTDLSVWRGLTGLIGATLLLFGLIWESR